VIQIKYLIQKEGKNCAQEVILRIKTHIDESKEIEKKIQRYRGGGETVMRANDRKLLILMWMPSFKCLFVRVADKTISLTCKHKQRNRI